MPTRGIDLMVSAMTIQAQLHVLPFARSALLVHVHAQRLDEDGPLHRGP